MIANGTVYFGSGDGNVYALDAASGASSALEVSDRRRGARVSGVCRWHIFVGSWDSYFYAIDAASGKEKWRFKTGDDPNIHNQVGIQGSARSNGVVYFGCRDSNFYAVDALSGKQKWVFNNKGSWVIGSPAVEDGKVYFATSDSGLFYELDGNSGQPVFSLDFKHWPMFSSPAIAGNTLYISSHSGNLIAINLTSRKVTWTFQTDGSHQNGATYTKPDGSPNYKAAFWQDFFYDNLVAGVLKMMSVGAILSSPVIVDRVIYVGSTDGYLYALM